MHVIFGGINLALSIFIYHAKTMVYLTSTIFMDTWYRLNPFVIRLKQRNLNDVINTNINPQLKLINKTLVL